MNLRAIVRAMVTGCSIAMTVIAASGCGLPEDQTASDASVLSDEQNLRGGQQPQKRRDASVVVTDAPIVTPPVDAAVPPPPPPVDAAVPPPPPPPTSSFVVRLVPDGVSGVQRVNFAVPFAAGALTAADQIKLLAGTTERPADRRILARYPDGSARSNLLIVCVGPSAFTAPSAGQIPTCRFRV